VPRSAPRPVSTHKLRVGSLRFLVLWIMAHTGRICEAAGARAIAAPHLDCPRDPDSYGVSPHLEGPRCVWKQQAEPVSPLETTATGAVRWRCMSFLLLKQLLLQCVGRNLLPQYSTPSLVIPMESAAT